MPEDVYRKVYVRTWYDDKFKRLSRDGQLMWLYHLANPHGHLAGIFILPYGYAAEDLGWPDDELRRAWDEVIGSGMSVYDRAAKVILIPNFLKYNPLENRPCALNAVKHVAGLPETPLKTEWVRIAIVHSSGFESPGRVEVLREFEARLSAPSGNGVGNGLPYRNADPPGDGRGKQEQEQEQNQEQDIKPFAPRPEEKPPIAPLLLWPAGMERVPEILKTLGYERTLLNDPGYWVTQLAWIDSTGFNIGLLDEFKGYAAHQASLKTNARNKDHRRGFRNWIAMAIRWRQRDAARDAQRKGR